MLHFTRVCTDCKEEKDKNFETYNLTPRHMYNGPSQVYRISYMLFYLTDEERDWAALLTLLFPTKHGLSI